MPQATAPSAPGRPRAQGHGLPHQPLPREALLREAEAQRALAELFPHLQPDAMRAIQALFPLARAGGAAANDARAH